MDVIWSNTFEDTHNIFFCVDTHGGWRVVIVKKELLNPLMVQTDIGRDWGIGRGRGCGTGLRGRGLRVRIRKWIDRSRGFQEWNRESRGKLLQLKQKTNWINKASNKVKEKKEKKHNTYWIIYIPGNTHKGVWVVMDITLRDRVGNRGLGRGGISIKIKQKK
jgi:hypothetical protein